MLKLNNVSRQLRCSSAVVEVSRHCSSAVVEVSRHCSSAAVVVLRHCNTELCLFITSVSGLAFIYMEILVNIFHNNSSLVFAILQWKAACSCLLSWLLLNLYAACAID